MAKIKFLVEGEPNAIPEVTGLFFCCCCWFCFLNKKYNSAVVTTMEISNNTELKPFWRTHKTQLAVIVFLLNFEPLALWSSQENLPVIHLPYKPFKRHHAHPSTSIISELGDSSGLLTWAGFLHFVSYSPFLLPPHAPVQVPSLFISCHTKNHPRPKQDWSKRPVCKTSFSLLGHSFGPCFFHLKNP